VLQEPDASKRKYLRDKKSSRVFKSARRAAVNPIKLHSDDAFSFIVHNLHKNLEAFVDRPQSAWDVSLQSIVWTFVGQLNGTWQIGQFRYSEDLQDVWRAFDDAAWRLCRMGIFRLTPRARRLAESTAYGFGDYFAITSAGRAWLENSELPYIPAEPRRYVELLEKEKRLLGRGFEQRAREAASCHQAGNFIACCAMCGAAAESAILATAIEKTGDANKVLREYGQRDGRRKVLTLIFGQQPGKLEQRYLEAAFGLLSYWRDDAAHGQVSEISEIGAYHSLTLLLRLAQFLFANWNALTRTEN
jgi:hypothetical protein